ncbi:ureidoglycolate lyase [Polaromonas sp. CG_9.11]|uniref:ureidoglycolate lyase n=1 Tax=Polaromonas sp. CG_9.11 TaxID=2787730 RepID=UPI0018C90C24|nr:ureidoglycolate lyase [Polaromonas sp. CG_9.11]MBG6077761.1 ureidoglycolate lyase [Polaromonas sp. CG_9.11]
MRPVILRPEALTAAAFSPFGDVIEARDGAQRLQINQGHAERYHDLASVDLAGQGARALISIFRSQPRQFPLFLNVLERHPLGSQAFMPLAALPYLVVVAPGIQVPDLQGLRCFIAAPGQGVNYARGTWHHPLLSLEATTDFLVVDRGGPGVNLEEHALLHEHIRVLAPTDEAHSPS